MKKYVVFFKNGGSVMLEARTMYCDREDFKLFGNEGRLIAFFRWECLSGFIVKEGE